MISYVNTKYAYIYQLPVGICCEITSVALAIVVVGVISVIMISNVYKL